MDNIQANEERFTLESRCMRIISQNFSRTDCPGFPKHTIFYFPFFLLALTLISPWTISEGFAREAGWVPLETNQAKNLTVPLKKRPPARKKELKETHRIETSPLLTSKSSVYTNQPPVTEGELESFVLLLPRFRKWARSNGEEAHPIVNSKGEPDFQYSARAAQWVLEHNFDPLRFFCVMGRMAAGLVVVEEGNDYHGTRPADMPGVSAQELGLVRKHLGELLAAGGSPAPLLAE